MTKDEELAELRKQVTNLTSTIAAWNHAEIMKCGCRYSRVWGGTKWEHWLVTCQEHVMVKKEKAG